MQSKQSEPTYTSFIIKPSGLTQGNPPFLCFFWPDPKNALECAVIWQLLLLRRPPQAIRNQESVTETTVEDLLAYPPP